MESTRVGTNGDLAVVGNDAIEILENDHRTIKQLLLDLTSAEEMARKQALERLKALLTVHNATEENLVYPAIHDLAERPMHANGLYKEQDQAKVAVFELSMLSPGDPEFTKKAAALRDAVYAHIEKEETSEFRHLREAAEANMPELTAQVRRFRKEFVFSPSA